MAEASYSTQLPTLHRYITTRNADGKSVYTTSPEQEYLTGPGRLSGRTYAVEGFPIKLEGDHDIKAYLGGPENPASIKNHAGNIVLPGGSSCNVVELAPGATSPMHQTVSLDYSICTNGVLLHELDGGETVTLHPGDHIVQRGTMHRWINGSKTEAARFVAISIPVVPYDIDGKLLKEEWIVPGGHR